MNHYLIVDKEIERKTKDLFINGSEKYELDSGSSLTCAMVGIKSALFLDPSL